MQDVNHKRLKTPICYKNGNKIGWSLSEMERDE